MEKEAIIKKTADYVRGRLEDDASGHDWWHVWRVWNLARRIGAEENADMFVVEMAASLHDISDGNSAGMPRAAQRRPVNGWRASRCIKTISSTSVR